MKLQIISPCPVPNQKLLGRGVKKYCEHCQSPVYCLSFQSEFESKVLLWALGQREKCISFFRSASGDVLFDQPEAKKPIEKPNKPALFAAMLALSACSPSTSQRASRVSVPTSLVVDNGDVCSASMPDAAQPPESTKPAETGDGCRAWYEKKPMADGGHRCVPIARPNTAKSSMYLPSSSAEMGRVHPSKKSQFNGVSDADLTLLFEFDPFVVALDDEQRKQLDVVIDYIHKYEVDAAVFLREFSDLTEQVPTSVALKHIHLLRDYLIVRGIAVEKMTLTTPPVVPSTTPVGAHTPLSNRVIVITFRQIAPHSPELRPR